jgi:hypothetical protein
MGLGIQVRREGSRRAAVGPCEGSGETWPDREGRWRGITCQTPHELSTHHDPSASLCVGSASSPEWYRLGKAGIEIRRRRPNLHLSTAKRAGIPAEPRAQLLSCSCLVL